MGDFAINTRIVKQQLIIQENIASRLNKLEDELLSIRSSLGFVTASHAQIQYQLKALADEINAECIGINNMKAALEFTVDKYEQTEAKICGNVEPDTTSVIETLADIGIIGIGASFCAAFPWLAAGIASNELLAQGLGAKLGDNYKVDTEYKSGLDLYDLGQISGNDFIDKIKDWEKDHKKEVKDRKYFKDGRWIDVPNDDNSQDKFDSNQMDQVATIYSQGISASKEKIHAEGTIEGNYGSLHGEVDVLKGEASANAYAGIYATGPDGEKIFAPGLGAEVGVSGTAFSASGLAVLGSDMLGAYVEGGVTAGEASAKAGVDVGLFDENGKLNPQANVNASVEVIAVEAEVEGGVKVLGTDVGVKGGVNIGVGAHADVGIKDGVISLDLGASLGVGVSLELEIDMSGTVDAVTDVAKSAWNTVTGFFK